MLMFKTYYPPPLYPLFQGFLTQLMSPYIRWIDSITAKTCPHFPLHADAPVRLFQLPSACSISAILSRITLNFSSALPRKIR